MPENNHSDHASLVQVSVSIIGQAVLFGLACLVLFYGPRQVGRIGGDSRPKMDVIQFAIDTLVSLS